MANTSMLPEELFWKIFQYPGASDLASLCQVSRHIHGITTQLLYADLVLDAPSKAIQVFHVVLKRELAAQSVRRLSLNVQCDTILFGFYKLAAQAICKTTRITSLHTARMSPLLRLLRSTRLPHLTTCCFPYSNSATHFLGYHNTIDYLKFTVKRVLDLNNLPNIITLPNLTFYDGPAAIAPYVLKNSRVTGVSLWWAPMDDAYDLLHWKTEAKIPLRATRNITSTWDQADTIIRVLATNSRAPNLQRLVVENWGLPTSDDETEVFLKALDRVLGSFKHLVILELRRRDSANISDEHRLMQTLDKEHNIVVRWGEHCPSLQVITLPFSGATWCQDPKTDCMCLIPVPIRASDSVRLTSLWFFRAFQMGKYPQLQGCATLSKSLRTLLDGLCDAVAIKPLASDGKVHTGEEGGS